MYKIINKYTIFNIDFMNPDLLKYFPNMDTGFIILYIWYILIWDQEVFSGFTILLSDRMVKKVSQLT